MHACTQDAPLVEICDGGHEQGGKELAQGDEHQFVYALFKCLLDQCVHHCVANIHSKHYDDLLPLDAAASAGHFAHKGHTTPRHATPLINILLDSGLK